MKVIIILSILMFYIQKISYSGVIYGIIQSEKPSLAKELEVKFTGKKVYKTKTDKNGMFNVNIKETGKLFLNLNYKNFKLQFKIFSMQKPHRYDFIIIKKDNKYIIKRK